MMGHVNIKHLRGKSLVELPASEFNELDSVLLECHGEHCVVPVKVLNDEQICFEIPHEFLLNVLNIQEMRLMISRHGMSLNLLEVEGYTDILDCFDIDTLERFWSRVASTARPIRDEQLLRLVCKRAVKIHRDFAVLGAALCALGYRILDVDDHEDPDLPWLKEHAQALFDWEDKVTPYDDARWGTSVLMLLGYVYLNFQQVDQALTMLTRLLHYRSAIKVAPLIQTNLVRTSMILADYEMSQGNFDRALLLLREVPRIAKEGVWWSDLTEPVAGAFKYTEFDVVVCGAKEALKLSARMPELIEKNQRRACRLQDLGGYAGVLIRRERLNYAG
jgi:hypothetical protein